MLEMSPILHWQHNLVSQVRLVLVSLESGFASFPLLANEYRDKGHSNLTTFGEQACASFHLRLHYSQVALVYHIEYDTVMSTVAPYSKSWLSVRQVDQECSFDTNQSSTIHTVPFLE